MGDFGAGFSFDWPAWDYGKSSVFVSLLGEWNSFEYSDVSVLLGAKVSYGRDVMDFETWSNHLAAVTPYASAVYSFSESIGFSFGLALPGCWSMTLTLEEMSPFKGGDLSLGVMLSF